MTAQMNNPNLSILLRRTLDKNRGRSADVGMTNGNTTSIKFAGAETQASADQPVSDALKLHLLDQALTEVESERAANLSSAPSELKKPGLDLPPLDASPVSPSKKEAVTPSQNAVEQGANIQVVETERSPELSPEVEKYLQEVHQEKDQAPKEIVLDDVANLPSDNQFVSEPVIVVPITPEIERKGKRKSPKFSIRWLVEWSQKVIKMFSGKVVYLQPPQEN